MYFACRFLRFRPNLISYRNCVQTAPQMPGSHRAPRCPRLSNFTRLEPGDRLAAEIVLRDCLEQARIIQRENIGTVQVENQKHISRPAAYTTNGAQVRNNGFVRLGLPCLGVDSTSIKVSLQINNVYGLAFAPTPTMQGLVPQFQNKCRRERLATAAQQFAPQLVSHTRG